MFSRPMVTARVETVLVTRCTRWRWIAAGCLGSIVQDDRYMTVVSEFECLHEKRGGYGSSHWRKR